MSISEGFCLYKLAVYNSVDKPRLMNINFGFQHEIELINRLPDRFSTMRGFVDQKGEI